MGNLYTAGLADAVTDHHTGLRQAVGIHITANFYPPLPGEYVGPLVNAIEYVAQGDSDNLIELPKDINPLPRTAEFSEDAQTWVVSAENLVETLRAWAFVDAVLEVSE